MGFNLPPVGGVDNTGQGTPATKATGAAPGAKGFSKLLGDAQDVHVDTIPATPPPEVRADVARASARYDELQSQHREMHFATDKASGRLVIEVRDLDGNVIRTIPPSKALDVISGEKLD
jgi:flagellar protein FlaG